MNRLLKKVNYKIIQLILKKQVSKQEIQYSETASETASEEESEQATEQVSEGTSEQVAQFPVRDEKIPPYEIELRDGSVIKLDQFEGQVVMMTFFTTW